MSKFNRDKMIETITFINQNIIESAATAIVIQDAMSEDDVAALLRDAFKKYNISTDTVCVNCGENMPEPNDEVCLFCGLNYKVKTEVKVEKKDEVIVPHQPVETPLEETNKQYKKRGRKKKSETAEEAPSPETVEESFEDVTAEEAANVPAPPQVERPATVSVNEKALKSEETVKIEEKVSPQEPIIGRKKIFEIDMVNFLVDTNASITIAAKALYNHFMK